MEEKKTYGEIGYEAYAKSTGGKTFDGRNMPQWNDLPPNIVAAWGAAGLAIASAFADDARASEVK